MGAIGIVHPPAAARRSGNRVTALRWAAHLRQLGRHVFLADSWRGRACELLVVLHAEKSRDAIVRFSDERPDSPILVAAAGTDLYGDKPLSAEAIDSFARATRIIVLQKLAIESLPHAMWPKTRILHQSAVVPAATPRTDVFEVCVLAHLRPVKDPMLAAVATRLLRKRSRIRVLLLGRSLDDELRQAVETEAAANPRFEWLGELRRPVALSVLARSRLLVSPSQHEGGASALTEALAGGIPILATRIPGSEGVLGVGHPGLFRPGDSRALAALLTRAEEDERFYATLQAWTHDRAFLADPRRERRCWAALLDELRQSKS